MKIYTSYFGNSRKLSMANVMQIGIAIWKPKFFNGPCMYNLAPTKYMLSDNCSREEYIRLYKQILAKLNAQDVFRQIERISKGQDVAICCYEKPGDFCHRHLFAEWFTKETGIEVKEFVLEEQPKEEQKRKNNPLQMSFLF